MMKQTFIYRISDQRSDSSVPDRFIYAVNKPAAKRWQQENCPEIKAKFECIGIKKVPIDIHAQEFTQLEYMAIRKHVSDMTNPDLWKEFLSAK